MIHPGCTPTGTAVMFIEQKEESGGCFYHLVLTGLLLTFRLNYAQPQAGLKNRHILANFNFLTDRRAAFALTVPENPVRVRTLSVS